MDKTKKKNQHYVPKFYLRNFSFESNKREIGLYNVDANVFVQRAKLKTQASEDYFYGQDGKIEDELSIIENSLSPLLTKIIDSRKLPNKKSNNHALLLMFLVLTDLRTPVSVNSVKNSALEVRKRLKELDPEIDIDNFYPKIPHDTAVEVSLESIEQILVMIMDLDFKFLINKTSIPFITSDLPIVKYNQFLEQNKWPYSKTGYATVGLQLFLPLNAELSIVFYDSGIYKVGDKKKSYLNINNIKDVNSLNRLQLINCNEALFFNEDVSNNYISSLLESSKKYNRAHKEYSKIGYIHDSSEEEEDIEKENLIILGNTECEIDLSIEGIKVHSTGKSYVFADKVVQLRKWPKLIMNAANEINRKNNERTIKNF